MIRQILVFSFLFILVCNINLYAHSMGMGNREDFNDMYNCEEKYNSTLTLNLSESDEQIKYFDGEAVISGVLVYHYYVAEPETNGKWRFIFYPDNAGKKELSYGYSFDQVTLLKDIDNITETQMLITSDSINISDDEFKKIFKDVYSKKDRAILGGIAVNVELSIDRLLLPSEGGYFTQFNTDNINVTGTPKKWYMTRDQVENNLCLVTEDSYSNLRKSPNGDIIQKIYKESLNGYDEYSDDKGFLIEIVDSHATDSKWIKAAYLDKNKDDFSLAVVGYIHKSQVGYCK